MKILLLGKNGQVGWELQRSLAPLGDVVALDSKSTGLCGDLANLQGLAETVRQVKPQVIVNAAAYTAVDKAESEQTLAKTVNTLAAGVLAQEAAKLDAWLVHYSTDYVFDGSGTRPWVELDTPAPLNVYGHSKLEGERLIVQHCPKHLIFRTSWVYGARGGNFAKTMLKLAQERETLKVIHDQTGAPTGADLLADVTVHALRSVLPGAANPAGAPHLAGIYHAVASGSTTWFDYANHVIAQQRRAQAAINFIVKDIQPVSTSAFPTPARRPHNSRLDTTRLQKAFGLEMPDWQLGVDRMLAEIA